MKILKITGAVALLLSAFALTTACDDGKTYAELLTEESQAVNRFLADQRVVNSIPVDTVFETVAEYGDDAPYYRLDEDGNLYMQVIDAGTPGNMVTDNELIYFRFTRYPIATYADGEFTSAEGNDDVMGGNLSFRYGNFDLSSSYSYGTGIQTPLAYLPVDCRVNIVIKSAYGMPSEMSSVVPWLYTLRYYRPKF